jgi:flagellar basal body P-ring formation protein FlgA
MCNSPSKIRRLAGLGLLMATRVLAQEFQPTAEIEMAARAEAQKRLPALAPNQRLVTGPLDARLRLTPCPQALEADVPAGARLRDRVMVEVECLANPGWRTYVPVRIAGMRKAVVLRRSVVVGQVLKPEDVETLDSDPAQLPLGYFDDTGAVAGMTAGRSMAAGSVLSNQSLKLPNVILRGQTVTLLARGDGLNVRMAGRAMSDGYLNQRIKVQNISSGKLVEGIARSEQLVEINSR